MYCFPRPIRAHVVQGASILPRQNAKTCDCLYLLLCHNKITIDEGLNSFIVCSVLFYNLQVQCADFNLETGA